MEKKTKKTEKTRKREKVIRLTLPIPPSVNTAYCNGIYGRYKSKDCKAWQMRVYPIIRASGFFLTGDDWLSVEYKYFFSIYNKNGTKKIKDVGNYEKVLSDTLAYDDKTGLGIRGVKDHKFKKIFLEKNQREKGEEDYVDIIIKKIKEKKKISETKSENKETKNKNKETRNKETKNEKK